MKAIIAIVAVAAMGAAAYFLDLIPKSETNADSCDDNCTESTVTQDASPE